MIPNLAQTLWGLLTVVWGLLKPWKCMRPCHSLPKTWQCLPVICRTISELCLTESCTDVAPVPHSGLALTWTSHAGHLSAPWTQHPSSCICFDSSLWMLFPLTSSPSGLSTNATSSARSSLTTLSKGALHVTLLCLILYILLSLNTFVCSFAHMFICALSYCSIHVMRTGTLSVLFSCAWNNASHMYLLNERINVYLDTGRGIRAGSTTPGPWTCMRI